MSNEPYSVKEGTSLFQLCTPVLEAFEEILFVDKLDITGRGEGGFVAQIKINLLYPIFYLLNNCATVTLNIIYY